MLRISWWHPVARHLLRNTGQSSLKRVYYATSSSILTTSWSSRSLVKATLWQPWENLLNWKQKKQAPTKSRQLHDVVLTLIQRCIDVNNAKTTKTWNGITMVSCFHFRWCYRFGRPSAQIIIGEGIVGTGCDSVTKMYALPTNMMTTTKEHSKHIAINGEISGSELCSSQDQWFLLVVVCVFESTSIVKQPIILCAELSFDWY